MERPGPDQGLPVLTWGPCDTSDWTTGIPFPALGVKCALIEVPLDHEDPGGDTISLRVARHLSRSYPTGKAIFSLAGGPGGSAVEQSGFLSKVMPELLDTFDLVYVDQRGTGGSGKLNCSGGYPYDNVAWRACGEELASTPLEHHSTLAAAHDIELVRHRLGYQQISIRGGSYGTRLGLELLRQYPQRIAAAVLDGLVPPDWDMLGALVARVDVAVAGIIEECQHDPACLEVSPTLEDDLLQRLAMLEAEPRAISVDGQPYQEDGESFANFLNGALDAPATRYKVPRAIHQAVGGDNALWNQLLSAVFGYDIQDALLERFPSDRAPRAIRPRLRHRPILGDSSIAPGHHMNIICSEFLPNTEEGIAGLTELAGGLIWPGAWEFVGMAQACAAWSAPAIGPDLRQPVSSQVKTLLMSGGVDLRTPSALGDHAAQTLQNSTHLVVPYTGHSTNSEPCGASIIAAFLIAGGEISQVDTACIQAVSHPGW